MCGIAGFINFNGHQREEAQDLLKRMTDSIRHRGPDAEGFFVDNQAALGHRRLAIIDLVSGQQPMSTVDGRLHIVFNGEIYNFLELRAELEAKGHRFQTKSDTEAILHAYREWGADCPSRLNGMFAFAVWDSETKTLFLARDRVGKKPLYYAARAGMLFFASELKALRAADQISATLDPEALDCYFSLGYIPSPLTIFREFRKLPPASTLFCTAKGVREARYWQLLFGATQERPIEEATDEFLHLFDETVRCRLMSEVPLGAFLSGGLDSSLVVASMAAGLENPVLTNSIGFGDPQYNELPAARLIAAHLRTRHSEYTVNPDAASVLNRIAWHFDEPFADSSAVPTWYVCQMARQNVTVALSGDGGDEGFGGYTFRYLPHIWESRIRQAIPAAMRGPLFGSIGALYPGSAKIPKPLRLKTIFENLAVSDAEAFYRDLIFLRADDRDALYSADLIGSLRGFTPYELVRPCYAGGTATDPLARSQQADVGFYMTEDVLVKVDRMSMAHALEVRSPLLDHRILEFAARLPASLKISGGKGKLLLRNAARRRLPAEILELPKKGFSIPAANWLRHELRPVAEEVIFKRESLLRSLLCEAPLLRLWEEHQRGARDHSVTLWGFMMFGLWEKNHY